MNKRSEIEEKNRQLFSRVLTALETPEEAMGFLEELCTPSEIKNIAQRIAVAELLMKNYTYDKIQRTLMKDESRISTIIINRMSAIVKYRKGYLRTMLRRAAGSQED